MTRYSKNLSKSGFSLIEMLVVIGIAGVLLAIGVSAFVGGDKNSVETTRQVLNDMVTGARSNASLSRSWIQYIERLDGKEINALVLYKETALISWHFDTIPIQRNKNNDDNDFDIDAAVGTSIEQGDTSSVGGMDIDEDTDQNEWGDIDFNVDGRLGACAAFPLDSVDGKGPRIVSFTPIFMTPDEGMHLSCDINLSRKVDQEQVLFRIGSKKDPDFVLGFTNDRRPFFDYRQNPGPKRDDYFAQTCEEYVVPAARWVHLDFYYFQGRFSLKIDGITRLPEDTSKNFYIQADADQLKVIKGLFSIGSKTRPYKGLVDEFTLSTIERTEVQKLPRGVFLNTGGEDFIHYTRRGSLDLTQHKFGKVVWYLDFNKTRSKYTFLASGLTRFESADKLPELNASYLENLEKKLKESEKKPAKTEKEEETEGTEEGPVELN